MAEVNLPPEWSVCTFSDLVSSSFTGLVRSAREQGEERTFKYLKMNNLDSKGNFILDGFTKVVAEPVEIERYSLQIGDFIFNTRNSVELVGKCGVFNIKSAQPILFNNNLLKVEFIEVEPRIVAHWLNSPVGKRNLRNITSATTSVAAIYQKQLFGLKLPLCPLSEQKVIADKLDTLLAQVESTRARLERIPEILKTFRQSVLAAAVSGKLTEEWRDGAAFKEHSVLFSSLIKESSVGLVRAAGEQYEDSNGRLPYVKMNNIDNFWGYNTDNLKYVDASKEERIKYGLGKDDWLFNTRNSTELVGKSCVWKGKEGLLYNNNILRVKFNDTVLADYVELFFKSPKGQQQLTAIKSGTTNVAAIYQKQLFKLSIYITDLEEQTEIVCRVEELFAFAARIEQKANTALQRVNKFTQSILAKGFRGELTSDWRAANPELISGENSAEALLERIKAEREALKPVRKSSVRKKS